MSGVTGVVTAKRADGFFMQDTMPDADPRTSEGTFVFTGAAPAASPGDPVRVGGKVEERRQGGDAPANANLTVTQITSSSVTVLSHGNPLPRPVIMGAGGRTPRGRVIEDDARGNVETGGDFDPASGGIDFYESLKGMLVTVRDAAVVGPSRTLRSGVRQIPVAAAAPMSTD